jgi:hypothetical protein
MNLNEIHYTPTNINFFVSSLPRFNKSSYAKHALRIESTETYTHYKQVKVVCKCPIYMQFY